MSDVRYYSRSTLMAHGLRSDAWNADDYVYTIDLDDILHIRPPPPDEQRYQHAERTFVSAFADCQRLRPDFRPDDAIAGELVRLRTEVVEMRRIVDAARRWAKTPGLTGQSDPDDAELLDALDGVGQPTTPAAGDHSGCRATWFRCAHCNVPCCMDCQEPRANPTDYFKTAVRWCPLHRERGQLGQPQLDVTPATLTPAQWSALFRLRDQLAWRMLHVEDDDRAAVITAIDLLRDAADARRNSSDDGWRGSNVSDGGDR